MQCVEHSDGTPSCNLDTYVLGPEKKIVPGHEIAIDTTGRRTGYQQLVGLTIAGLNTTIKMCECSSTEMK